MKSTLLAIFLIFVLTLSGSARQNGPPYLDVLLIESNQILISSDSGDNSVSLDGESIRYHGNLTQSPIAITPSSPIQFIIVNGKPYRGSVIISLHNGRLQAINHLTLEEYLYGVVGKEMPGAAEEALKAQAVASRTLAYNAYLKRKPIHATVTNQVYGGVNAERLAANQAVDDTRGLILTYGGKPAASPLFSSTCGGVTETSQDVFGKAIPYLVSVKDSDPGPAFCNQSPYFEWEYTYDKSQLEAILRPKGVHGDLQDLTASGLDPQGRVKTLWVKTSEGEWRFQNFAIRNAVKRPDGKLLPSTWFTIEKQGDAYILHGRGQGHGVGMCQWGAIGMAQQGKDFKAILSHYYSGAGLNRIY